MKNLSRVALFLFFICLGTSAAEKIDINTASLDDLVKIIHIGETRALELISLRPFSSIDDLIKIKGIGSSRLEDIKKQGMAYVGKNTGDATALPEITELVTEPEAPSEIKTTASFKIDINTASLQELQRIVGIGAALSQRIADMRPFYSLDEIVRVHGIGAGTLENIKSQGLAWVDPGLAPLKTKKAEPSHKGIADVSAPLQQIQDRQFPKNFSVFLSALVLAFFSGTIILILKRNLKTLS